MVEFWWQLPDDVLVVCIKYIHIQYVFTTNRFVFNTCQYCVGITYVLNYNTCKNRLNTCHNTCHNTCQTRRKRIGMYCNLAIHANTYQHVLACIALVLGMCEIMVRANTDQIHAHFFNTCHCWRQYIHQYDPIQINTSPNTGQYKHQYRRIHTTYQQRHQHCQISPPAPPVPPALPAS